MKRRIAMALIAGLVLSAAGYLALGSIRDVQCEVLDATGSPVNLSGRVPANPSHTVTIRFACTHYGWIPLSDVTAEVRIAEKDREIGGGWFTAGDLIAVQQVPLGTLEPGTPVVKRVRIRGLNWTRDVGIRVQPYQAMS